MGKLCFCISVAATDVRRGQLDADVPEHCDGGGHLLRHVHLLQPARGRTQRSLGLVKIAKWVCKR